jgi:hypothetical protein
VKKPKAIRCWRINSNRLRFSLSLSSIFKWCTAKQKADRLLVVLRMERGHRHWRIQSPLAERWIKKHLRKFLIEKFLPQGWPGTLSSDTPACVFVFQFSDEVREIILEKEPRLENWREERRPPLPEDICLFHSKRSFPVFMSAVHERDAWLFNEKRPKLKGLTGETLGDIGDFVFNGKYFCLPWARKRLRPNYKPVRVYCRRGDASPPL